MHKHLSHQDIDGFRSIVSFIRCASGEYHIYWQFPKYIPIHVTAMYSTCHARLHMGNILPQSEAIVKATCRWYQLSYPMQMYVIAKPWYVNDRKLPEEWGWVYRIEDDWDYINNPGTHFTNQLWAHNWIFLNFLFILLMIQISASRKLAVVARAKLWPGDRFNNKMSSYQNMKFHHFLLWGALIRV